VKKFYICALFGVLIKQLVDILLLSSFILISYLRNNYMFRPFSRPSSGWSYILFEETIQYAVLS